MGRKKSLIILPHLVDAGGDLSKKWFVEYSCRNPHSGKMERFREYAGFAKLETAEERRALAEEIIRSINGKLASGWSPFTKRKEVTYQDRLISESFAKRWGRERESAVTLRTYLSDFLALKEATVIPHSYQTYRSKLRIFCEWAERQGLDELHVACLTSEHIQDFMRHIVERNDVSRRTVSKYKQILHGFFDYMVKQRGALTENPVSGVQVIGRVTDEAPRPIPDKERKILLDCMRKRDPQLWLFCLMEYYCAIRPNELRLMKTGDIDMEKEVIRVSSTISKNRMTEYVNIPRQLLTLFRKMGIDGMDRELYLFSAGGEPGERPLGKNNFRFRFDRLRNCLGISPEYKLYSFKHTGGVALVNAGIDTWELQRHFRHKSIDTTEHYIRRNFAVKSDKIKNHFPDID